MSDHRSQGERFEDAMKQGGPEDKGPAHAAATDLVGTMHVYETPVMPLDEALRTLATWFLMCEKERGGPALKEAGVEITAIGDAGATDLQIIVRRKA